MKECPKGLIDAHWGYIQGVIRASLGMYNEDLGDVNLSEQEFHYRTAFAHGWKHAKEDSENDKQPGGIAEKFCTTCGFNRRDNESSYCLGTPSRDYTCWKAK